MLFYSFICGTISLVMSLQMQIELCKESRQIETVLYFLELSAGRTFQTYSTSPTCEMGDQKCSIKYDIEYISLQV